MNTPLKFAAICLLALSSAVIPVFGQKRTCSCDAAPGRTCHGTVTCPDGCTSLCGAGDTCYLSCWSDGFQPRITIKFVEKTGQEIAALLSAKIRKRIEFIPNPRNANATYDLELKDDDLFNVLNYLYKRGKVRFDGSDFSKIYDLRKQVRQGKKISVNLSGPVEDAVAKLAFASGKRLRITSGDPRRIISLTMQDASLDQIIARLSESAGVKIQDKD